MVAAVSDAVDEGGPEVLSLPSGPSTPSLDGPGSGVPVGRLVGARYRITGMLGEGGMGAVYAATHAVTEKRFALKRVHAHRLPSAQARARALREARAAARVRHPHVLEIYDVIEEDGVVYLVMELLEGRALSAFLDGEGLFLHDAVALLVGAMSGVEAVHAAGVVHRDLKPDNIVIVRDPERGVLVPKIIDFGLSSLADSEAATVTRSGEVMGSPRYISLEQLRASRDVDARADVYAFGVMLYECVAGAPPYDGATLGEQAIRFITTVPKELSSLCPELPVPLAVAITDAIAPDRERRTGTMEALRRAVAPYAERGAYPKPIPLLPRSERRRAEPGATTLPLAGSVRSDAVGASRELLPSLNAPTRRGAARPWLALALLGALVAVGWGGVDRAEDAAAKKGPPVQSEAAEGPTRAAGLAVAADTPRAPALPEAFPVAAGTAQAPVPQLPSEPVGAASPPRAAHAARGRVRVPPPRNPEPAEPLTMDPEIDGANLPRTQEASSPLRAGALRVDEF